jgi:pimeloyl-ACP methyl ester carboxylesterase
MLDHAIRKNCPESEQVTLVGLDWGSLIAYLYCSKYSARVRELITIDVGMLNMTKESIFNLMVIAGYQCFLAACFVSYSLGLPPLLVSLLIAVYPWQLIGPIPHESVMPKAYQC